MEIYRFRTAHALLDRYKELENRGFYFASLAELNDKIEGFREIYYKGIMSYVGIY